MRIPCLGGVFKLLVSISPVCSFLILYVPGNQTDSRERNLSRITLRLVRHGRMVQSSTSRIWALTTGEFSLVSVVVQIQLWFRWILSMFSICLLGRGRNNLPKEPCRLNESIPALSWLPVAPRKRYICMVAKTYWIRFRDHKRTIFGSLLYLRLLGFLQGL